MLDPTCAVCGGDLSGKQTRFCGRKCYSRHLQTTDAYIRSQMRRLDHSRKCEVCGECFLGKRDQVCCSLPCVRAKGRKIRDHAVLHRPGRHLPVAHPNPDPVTHLPAKHPAIAGVPRRTEWWKLIVSGPCAWCGGPFTGVAASWETRPIYCSKRCSGNASRARRGRFVIPRRVRLGICERDGWICQLCGDPVTPDLPPTDIWSATLDHVVCQSWAAGEPDHSPENLRLAHLWCNSVRGDERKYTDADFLTTTCDTVPAH